MEKLICPKCKGEEIKKGTPASSFVPVQLFPKQNRGTGSPITAEYCNDCGYIVSFYVDNPKDIT